MPIRLPNPVNATIEGRRRRAFWELVRQQHGVITRGQLIQLGWSASEIKTRIRTGRLHLLYRGVYAAGRPQLGRKGEWLAAVLSVPSGALLSSHSAAALWGILPDRHTQTTLSVTGNVRPRASNKIYRRPKWVIAEHARCHNNIPVTSVQLTLVDLATNLPKGKLEAAISEADRLRLINPEQLRRELKSMRKLRGVPALRSILDRQTFRLTDSHLERLFLRLVKEIGLPLPETGVRVAGFKADFLWRAQKLVVETDGLTYHRTPAEQAKDRRRDQAFVRAGYTALRFTHDQVRFRPEEVEETLLALIAR